MRTTLLVNPQEPLEENPRRRRRRRARPRARRRRRRNPSNPMTLRAAQSNPRRRRRARAAGKGIFDVVRPAVEVSVGAILAQAVPARLFKMNPLTTTQNRMSLANIAVGLALAFTGGFRFIPRQTANNLAAGAMARGIVGFAQGFLPENLRGLGQANVSESEVDETIRRLTAASPADAQVLDDIVDDSNPPFLQI